ncbi:hypothetical protein GCM10022630_31310 [Thermobifida alba]
MFAPLGMADTVGTTTTRDPVDGLSEGHVTAPGPAPRGRARWGEGHGPSRGRLVPPGGPGLRRGTVRRRSTVPARAGERTPTRGRGLAARPAEAVRAVFPGRRHSL